MIDPTMKNRWKKAVIVIAILWTMAGIQTLGADASVIPYDIYSDVLQTAVDDRGLVDYESLKSDPSKLDALVEAIAAVVPESLESLPEADRIAFWINAYNILTIEAVVDHYPVKSIKDIGSFFQSVWDKLKFQAAGNEVTLNDIENKILRKKFDEPRIHMAINCASMSCPKLRREPYTGDKLDAQLDDQAKGFLSDAKNYRIDMQSVTVYLSSIFKWFGEDFVSKYGSEAPRNGIGKEEDAVLNFIDPYLDDVGQKILLLPNLKINYLDYDWDLNKQ